MEQPFISAGELATYLRYPSGSMDQSLAALSIQGACQQVVDFLEQEVEPSSAAIWLTGSGTDLQRIPYHPVTEITEVLIDDEELVEDDYTWDQSENAIIRDESVFPMGPRRVKVTFEYGHVDVPATIKLVALQLAARIYEMGPYSSENVGSSSETMIEGGAQLNHLEKLALAQYRKFSWL